MTDGRTARGMGLDPALLAAALTPQHAADVVEVLNEQPPQIASQVLAHLPFDLAVEVLDHPNLEASAALMQGLPAEQALTFIPAMSADRAAELFSAMQHYEADLAKAVVLTLFIPLIISSGGNSGSQATSLLIRALALQEVRLADWWRVVLRELPTGMTLGAILGVIGMGRIALWQVAGLYDYGEHWRLIALTIGAALVGVVTFGSLAGSMLPLLMRAMKFDPATASAPFVATLVDVTGIVIYLSIAVVLLTGTVL